MKEIKIGLALNTTKLHEEMIDGKTYYLSSTNIIVKKPEVFLLPGFDEYVVAYKDRNAILEEVHKQRVNPGSNGMLSPVIVQDGQVIGTWKRVLKNQSVDVSFHPFTKFDEAFEKQVAHSAENYSRFLGLSLRPAD